MPEVRVPWTEQKYPKFPAEVKVWEKTQELEAAPLLKLPSSAFTVWMPPLLVQVTVSPTWILRLLGLKDIPGPRVTLWLAARAGSAVRSRSSGNDARRGVRLGLMMASLLRVLA
jgi:hypothetical protein